MKQAPKDMVSPDEIVNFIKKQNVSEEAATGIKLLRRAAETIAHLQYLVRNPDAQPEQDPIDHDDLDARADILDQINTVLGLDGDEAPEDLIEKIEKLVDEREVHLAAIKQRDSVIEQADREINRLNEDRGLEPTASPDQAVVQEAVKFGYALIGLSYTDGLPEWVVSGAQGIIEYGKSN